MGNHQTTITSSTWKSNITNKIDKIDDNKNDNEKQKNTFSADTMYPQLLVYKDVACQTGNGINDDDDDVDENVKSSNHQKSSLSRMIVISFIMYLSFLVVVMYSPLCQSYFAYLHILRYPRGDLTKLHQVGLADGRNIEIVTDDGVSLKGYHIMPPGPMSQLALTLNDTQKNDYFNEKLSQTERIIIYFHGNGGSRALSFRLNKIKALASQLSSHVITIDYRGFADSTGYPSEEGTHNDSIAVLNWINNVIIERNQHYGYLIHPQDTNDNDSNGNECKGTRPPPYLYIYGHSLGTAIGTHLAVTMSKIAPGSLKGLILDAPFTTLTEAAFSHPISLIFRLIPGSTNLIKKYLHYKYPSIERIGFIETNLLLLHGIKDWKIPVSHSRQLYKTATASQYSKRNKHVNHILLKEIPDADHNDVYKSIEWLKEIPQFIHLVENDVNSNKISKRCYNPSLKQNNIIKNYVNL